MSRLYKYIVLQGKKCCFLISQQYLSTKNWVNTDERGGRGISAMNYTIPKELKRNVIVKLARPLF